LVAVFTLANAGWAQSLTNFPLIGITRAQTLQINLVAWPPDPCTAQLGFQDINGNSLMAPTTVTLSPGQTTTLAINGNTLTSTFGQRVEVLPMVIPIVSQSTTFVPTGQCVATAEVFDNVFGITTVAIPGAVGYAPVQRFGLVGVTLLQTARIKVVAYPPDPCIGQLSFLTSNGTQVGNTLSVQLLPGQAALLDLPGSALVTKLGQRAEVQPVLVAPNSPSCVASAEVYVNGLGTTIGFWPPDPCSPSADACVAH